MVCFLFSAFFCCAFRVSRWYCWCTGAVCVVLMCTAHTSALHCAHIHPHYICTYAFNCISMNNLIPPQLISNKRVTSKTQQYVVMQSPCVGQQVVNRWSTVTEMHTYTVHLHCAHLQCTSTMHIYTHLLLMARGACPPLSMIACV